MNELDNQQRSDSPADALAGVGRKLFKLLFVMLGIAALGLVATSSVLFVDQTEYVIVERFGDIIAVYDRVFDPGLHFKCPWPIDTVRRFDRRIQLFDPPGREIFTRDKKNITIDSYICWQIAEPDANASLEVLDRPVVRFFRGFGSIDVAETRLDSRLRSILTTRIGQVELSALLNVEDSESGPGGALPGLLETITDEVRTRVVQRPGENQTLAERLGIEIVDVRIKRINLPLGNQQAVFERMKSERKKIADRYRSAGMAENRMIKSQADLQYAEILAKAQRRAEEIRGNAEAESIRILNDAHRKDPDFYRVVRTLDAYKKILNEKTTLVLSSSSNLLKLLTEGVPDGGDKKQDEHNSPSHSPSEGANKKVSGKTSGKTKNDPAIGNGTSSANAPSSGNTNNSGGAP